MEATIKNGTVDIPEGVRTKVGLPDNGVCKIYVLDGEIRITGSSKPPSLKLSIIEDIKAPPVVASIKEIMEAEIVDAD